MYPKIRRTHLSLFVTDPERSAIWYKDVLGMVESARGDVTKGEHWIMMTFGQKHHDIALIKAAANAQLGGIGLQHYGLEIEGNMETLQRLYGMLLSKGVQIVKTTDHEIGNGLYFNDPDGNRLEFFLDTEHDDELAKKRFKEAHAPSRPFDLKPIYE